MVKFVQIFDVEYAHTYINRFVELYEFAQFDADQIFRKVATTVKFRFRDHCLRAVPRATVGPILLLILYRRDSKHFSVLPNALFINLYKLFSKLFFERILNCVLNSMHSRSKAKLIVIFNGSLLREDHDEYIAACFGSR